MFENFEVRGYARQRLKGNWLMAALTVLVYGLIVGAVSVVIGMVDNPQNPNLTLRFVSNIVSILIYGPMTFGIAYLWISFNRGNALQMENLFHGFKGEMFGKTFLLGLIQNIYIFLWSLLFLIPGIIKALSYSMSFYIMVDHPEYNYKDCIDASKAMMDGFKLQLLLLYLSFIGWAILSVFTLGIGYFFLAAYVQTSTANFYERIKGRIFPAEAVQPDQSNPV